MNRSHDPLSHRHASTGRSGPVGLLLFLGVLLVLGGITAYFSFVTVRRVVASWEITQAGGAAVREGTPEAPGSTSLPSGEGAPAPAILLPTPNPWDGASRVTVLVMGLDYRDWEAGEGAARTDTMILLTVDPLTRTAGILSLQRDLWVTIPGFEGYYKINTAYRFGELYELPGGGPALAKKTVERLIGVPIDFYAQIDFSAFERFIDEIGGIEIEVSEKIRVDPIGPANTVVLDPGRHTLDGPTALGYARNRSTKNDDFDRAARQQQVILAIRNRLLSLDMLPRLVYKAPALYKELGEGVHTDMTLEQAIQLAWLAQQIPEGSLKRAMIGPNEVVMGTSPDGLSILKPVPSRIRMLRDELFTVSLQPGGAGLATQEAIRTESARIYLINNTGDPAVAERTGAYLQAQGFTVAQTTPGQEILGASRLIDHTGNPYTVRSLVEILKIQPNQVRSEFGEESEYDITVFLGKDWPPNLP